MPLDCLPLKCLLRTRTARINDGHVSYFAEAPCSSPLNVKAVPPTCSVRSISTPHARRCLALGPHPPPTIRSCFIGTGRGGGGGGVIAREIVASRVQAPPAFCTEAKVAKGGAYLRDTTVQYFKTGTLKKFTLRCMMFFKFCNSVQQVF